jgi:hypothetical protein
MESGAIWGVACALFVVVWHFASKFDFCVPHPTVGWTKTARPFGYPESS